MALSLSNSLRRSSSLKIAYASCDKTTDVFCCLFIAVHWGAMTLTKLLPSLLITYLDSNVSFLSLCGAIFYLQRDIESSKLFFSQLLSFFLFRIIDARARLVWMELDRQALECVLDFC